ncbi:MAG: 16S rRNA (guanine(527)-N(7))-methyltransferase RsmG [Desulfobacterales bacterium]|jgi:16S rRNA (guanine527-N7)-methyltransferase
MEIGSREWQNLIIDGAQTLGIEIDESATAQFSVHAFELIEWNRKINLTSITQPRDIAVKHFIDSLAPAQFIPANARLLDIGSGSGFPGIPLKILKPSVLALLIDGVRKRVNFLKHLVRTLKLERIEAYQVRAQNLIEHAAFSKSFDIIISRALSSLDLFFKMAVPLLTAQGTIIAMKGKLDQIELDQLRSDAPKDRYHIEVKSYKLPSICAQRSIVIIRPKG